MSDEPPQFAADRFVTTLVDLGDAQGSPFRGVWSPQPEIGASKDGVDAVFLENAEDYYRKYQGFDYWRMLIDGALARLSITKAATVVEFGCGFGNSTLPLLDIFPRGQIIATDISPNLLAILKRLLDARNLAARCVPVAMDAQKNYLVEDCADLVVGSAILHHLADPGGFVRSAVRILKPGGAAIFFEPFEAGNALLRLICLLIGEEADRRKVSTRGLQWLKQIPGTLEPQIKRASIPGWKDRNDKWAFPRSILEGIARDVRAELITYPIHDNKGQFTRHFSYMLQTYGGMQASDIPDWAWRIFERFDRDFFSPELLLDLPLEGCVIYRKLGAV